MLIILTSTQIMTCNKLEKVYGYLKLVLILMLQDHNKSWVYIIKKAEVRINYWWMGRWWKPKLPWGTAKRSPKNSHIYIPNNEQLNHADYLIQICCFWLARWMAGVPKKLKLLTVPVPDPKKYWAHPMIKKVEKQLRNVSGKKRVWKGPCWRFSFWAFK